MIQREEIIRPLQDTRRKGKCQYRVGFVDEIHKDIALYAHQLRIVPYDVNDHGFEDVLHRFQYYCQTSFLRPPKQDVTIAASKHQNFFDPIELAEIARWLGSLVFASESNWRIAFQVEALLHNGVANTEEVMELRPRIEALIRSVGDTVTAGDIMRRFMEAAAHRPLKQRVVECFESILDKKTRRLRTSPMKGRFFCHHVTFTPTRMLLEGPTITQSNRVIREYQGYEDHFLRVDFRDEDRLPYRWDRDVDVESYVRERVGTLLKGGFRLAGRYFDFLGYSSSALKEHAVWYVSSFHHPEKGVVNAQTIRESLGDFSGVIESPSRYGARMAVGRAFYFCKSTFTDYCIASVLCNRPFCSYQEGSVV